MMLQLLMLLLRLLMLLMPRLLLPTVLLLLLLPLLLLKDMPGSMSEASRMVQKRNCTILDGGSCLPPKPT